MRLSEHELKITRDSFQKYFGENDHLWLFGSRASEQKKGGDIDLYIETMNDNKDEVFSLKLNFIVELKKRLGDQKIDVVTNMIPYKQVLPIYQIAKETGIRIV